MSRSAAHGFTLIELMITLLVLGILVSLAAPSFTTYSANQQVKAVAYDLMASLNFARSEAVKRNTNISVSASGADTWGQGWDIGGLRVYTPKTAVRITAPAATITYAGNGRASTSSLTICDTAQSAQVKQRIVRIDASGRPTLELGGSCAP